MKPFVLTNKDGEKEILNLDQVLFIIRDTENFFSLNFHFPGMTYRSKCSSQEQIDNLINNVIECML